MLRRVVMGAVAATLVAAPAFATPAETIEPVISDELEIETIEAPETIAATDAPDGGSEDVTEPPVEVTSPASTTEPEDTTSPEPTEEPVVGDPTTDPVDPTEDPTDEPTDPITEIIEENRAPVINGLTPITAVSREYVTEADLYAGVTVTDDTDMSLIPRLIVDSAWNDPVECPNGYPCTYTMRFEVTDSEGAYADGVRIVTITGTGETDPEPTPDPTTDPTTEPTTDPTPEPTTDPTTDPVPTTDPTTEPADEGGVVPAPSADPTAGPTMSSPTLTEPTASQSDEPEENTEISDTGSEHAAAAGVATVLLLLGSVLAGRARRDASR